jgi:phosphoglucosamine mutase
MSRLFGTDGVRGIANKELTPQLAFELGRAGACLLSGGGRPVIVVGRDTRISGTMLEAALSAGICSMGGKVLLAGVVPTPAVAYLTRYFKADAGVVISASHNPVEYNGIKFFDKDGWKLPDEVEDSIENMLGKDLKVPSGDNTGYIEFIEDAVSPYVDFVKSTVFCDFTGLKIAVDCANGASFVAAPRALKEMGAQVITTNDKPDGKNINVKCGSTHIEAISAFVRETGADVGLAFDGDADRLIAVDEKGKVVNGDHIMAVCGIRMKRIGRLPKNTVVATVMSNLGLDAALKQAGCTVVKTKVGDRYVVEEMRKNGYAIGGEQSGHIVFLEYNTTGDGLITAFQLLSVLKAERIKLSELAGAMQEFPQVLVNVKVRDKAKAIADPEVEKTIQTEQQALGEEGRVLVRASGTEPIIRVMVEGRDEEYINEAAKLIATLIEKRWG